MQYSMMLLAEAMLHMLELYDKGKLQLSLSLLQERLPVVLTQIINRTLFTQSHTGSWGKSASIETTSYGILTLAAVSSIPWVSKVRGQMDHAIRIGQQFLASAPDCGTVPQYLWIEKVTYGSHIFSESYRLAALRPSMSSHTWSLRVCKLLEITEKSVATFTKVVSSLESFREQPLWRLEASAIEGHAFLPLLKSTRTDILPQQKRAKNEYLNYIPYTWVIVNNCRNLFIQANLLWDMMVLTTCNFRVDEYMENVVAKRGGALLGHLKSNISTLFAHVHSRGTSSRKRPHEDTVNLTNSTASLPETRDADISELKDFKITIGHYIEEMSSYARIQQASKVDREHFSIALKTFLLSHIAQMEDNVRFSAQDSPNNSMTGIFGSARTSYYTWVHTTAADSVSCPMSFAFFTCLLGASLCSRTKAEKCFSSVRQSYLARDLCAHLAVMSRMYNDYGSFVRDQSEANINSVNFPDFHKNCENGQDSFSEMYRKTLDWALMKKELLSLATYEREMAESVGNKLLSNLKSSGLRKDRSKADGIELFMGVTALYADLYVARDLSNYVDKVPK